MSLFIKIILLLLLNTLGFMAISLNVMIAQVSGAIDLSDTQTNVFIATFFRNSVITWMVCALFSLSFLFLKGALKFIFLLAPLVIPLGYGLSVLFLSAS